MAPKRNQNGSDSENEEGSDVEMLDVDFEFFDPQPIDYHSIKLLLSQLLSHDAPLLDLGGVTNIVLDQKLVGSTVKTDGAGGDPYALLTILNLNVHKDTPCVADLIKYLIQKIPSTSPIHAQLMLSLAVPGTNEASTPAEPKHIGLVLSERLVNMPGQIMPPMYNMLTEELEWALEDKEPYNFSHLLFLSRVFLSSADAFDEDPNAQMVAAPAGTKTIKRGKKAKKGPAPAEAQAEQVWPYHPEDEYIAQSCSHTHTFSYTTKPERSADSFGVETKGQVMLMPYANFGGMVKGMEAYFGAAMAQQ